MAPAMPSWHRAPSLRGAPQVGIACARSQSTRTLPGRSWAYPAGRFGAAARGCGSPALGSGWRPQLGPWPRGRRGDTATSGEALSTASPARRPGSCQTVIACCGLLPPHSSGVNGQAVCWRRTLCPLPHSSSCAGRRGRDGPCWPSAPRTPLARTPRRAAPDGERGLAPRWRAIPHPPHTMRSTPCHVGLPP
jgi:hypothetical protein